jgi:hypothetical protein
MRIAHTLRTAILRKGFTAMELLIALGLVAVTAGVTIPVYNEYRVNNDVNVTTEAIVQFLRGAQTLSQSGKFDSVWGVYAPEATLFAGEAYDVRNTEHDVVYLVPPTIDTDGIDEVVFTRLDGKPSQTGNIRVISTISGKYREITIDPNGIITVGELLDLAPGEGAAGGAGGTTTGGSTTEGSSTGGSTTEGTTGGSTEGSTSGGSTTGGSTEGTTGGSTTGGSTTGGTTTGGSTTGGSTTGTTGGTSGTDGDDDGPTSGDDDPGPSCNTQFYLDKNNIVKNIGTNDIKVKLLGSQITYGAGGPKIDVRVSASFNSGSAWQDLYNGKAVQGGELQTFANIASGTPFALQFNGRYSWLFNKTYRSDSKDGHVIILKNGDTPPNYPAFANQDGLQTFLRSIMNSSGKIAIGAKDLVYLVELGSLDSNADFQDAVVLVTFTEKALTCVDASKPRVKIDFKRIENAGDGDAKNEVIVGPTKLVFSNHQWIPLMDANGSVIVDGGLVEEVPGMAFERGPGWIRLLQHGSLTGGSKEIVDARVIFNQAYIRSTVNDTGGNATENPTDGTVNDTAAGDEFVAGPNAKSMTFKTRVTGEDDGVYLYWEAGQPSDGGQASSSSSSAPAASSSSSSAAAEDHSDDACYVPYTLDADGKLKLNALADVTLRIAGTQSTYGDRGPKVSVRGRISFNGGATWTQISSYRALRGGELSVFKNVPASSVILVEFEGRYSWVFRKTIKSGQGSSGMKVLRREDLAPNFAATQSRGKRTAFLKTLTEDNGKIKGTWRDVVYMTEMTEADSSGDFQDLVAVISIDKPQSSGGCTPTAVSSSSSSSAQGGGAASSSSSSVANPNSDDDKDSVKNSDDLCAGTAIPEKVPTEYMSFDRYALTANRGNVNTTPVFRVGPRKVVSKYTIRDTRGCSCAQMLDAIENKGSHRFAEHPALYRQMQNLFSFYTSNSRKFGCGDALMQMVRQSHDDDDDNDD